MIKKINDSKKSYFTWLGVTGGLFAVLAVLGLLAFKSGLQAELAISQGMSVIFAVAVAYIFATFPLGMAVRRSFAKWYMHVPTENLRVFETNLVVALGRLFTVYFAVGVNIALLIIYCTLSEIIGIFFTPYFIISGIVFMATGRYAEKKEAIAQIDD